jgi:ribonuclease P protein component
VLDNQCFNRELRLLKYSQFQTVKLHGQRLRDRHFILNAMPNDLGYPRIGLITSKKSLPKAVTRNKMRRCVREWFRANKQKLPSMDFVIIMTYSSATQCFSDINRCLDKLVQRLTA